MMTRFAAGLVCLASLLLADNYPRQPGVDIQHYVFRVALNDENSEIASETTVTVRFVQEGLTQFWLDLASASGGKGMTVSEVTAPYKHRMDRLTITLSPPSRAGETREFTVKYRGVPADGLKAVKNKFGERCFFSANWPDLAHQWLPTVDHPSDKATSEFLITAPVQYQVVANGRLVESRDLEGGRRLTHWRESTPIATWLNNIGVARFAVRSLGDSAGVALETWLFRQDSAAGATTFEEPTRRSMEFFSRRIGPYPYEKLADVEAAGMEGGMEHASAIFFGQNSVKGQPDLALVAHEIAHQWFGDAVTESDWDDVWLSEGFATYFQQLAVEEIEGREAFVNALTQSRRSIFATEKRLPGVAVVQNQPWHGIPNGIVYQKGGWALHMLRGQLGTEVFWNGIRAYYQRFRDGNASTADLRRVMEETSGQDLGWFFAQWLYRAGSPVIEMAWKYDAGAHKVELELTQAQPGEAFRLPLEVAVGGGGVTKIEMTAKHQVFGFTADQAPSSVELDPNTWLLAEIKR